MKVSELPNLLVQALKGEQKEFTTGSINKAIFMLSIPMIAEMLGEALFALFDMIFVSRISTNAVAAVALTEAPLMIVYSLAMGLSMAGTAIISRRIGEGKVKLAANAAFQAIVIGVFAGLLLGLPGLFFAEDVLHLMGGAPDLIQEGVGYTRIMYAANPVIILIFLLNGVFRGAGNAAIAMRSLLLANLCNLILDPIFIFGLGPIPAFGIEGAAMATTIGRSIGVIYQLYHLFKGSQAMKVSAENMVVNKKTITEFLSIGAAGFGQFFVETLSWLFLVRIVTRFGTDAVAGYQMAFRVIIFTLLPSWGMANAAATLVGQNLGAKQPGRAELSVWRTAKWNTWFLVVIAAIFGLLAEPILILLFEAQGEALATGGNALRIICFGYIFFAYGMVLGQAFNGAGDTKTPMYISLVVFWLIQIPLAYVLAVTFGWEGSGVFFSIAFSHSIYAVIAMVFFKRGKWKTVEV